MNINSRLCGIHYYNLTFFFSRFCIIKYGRTNLHTNTVALVVVFERKVHECEEKTVAER